MKTIVLGEGDSWDWGIESIIQVPDDFTKEKLWELRDEFNVLYFGEKIKIMFHHTNYDREKNREYIQRQIVSLNAQGYSGYGEGDVFISWLCKNQEFTIVPHEVWYL